MSSSGSLSERMSSEVWKLPLVQCPYCGIYLKRFVSTTDANPGKPFYKCDNHKINNCRFWKWEKDYEVYLCNIGVFGMQRNAVDELLEHEIVQLKNEHSRMVAYLKNEMESLKKIIFDMKNEIGDIKKDNYKLIKQNHYKLIVVIGGFLMIYGLLVGM